MRELTLLLSFSVKYRPDSMATSQSAVTTESKSRTMLYKEVKLQLKMGSILKCVCSL